VEELGERSEELPGQALDELQQPQSLLHDQVECRSDLDLHLLDLHLASRQALALLGRAPRRLAVRRPLRAISGSDSVQPTGHLINLSDGPIHCGLEDLIAGGRQ